MTLVVTALALLLGIALANTSVSHIHFYESQSKRENARNAAESVLALALEKVLADDTFSEGGHLELELLQGIGRLSFDSTQAASWSIPKSVSNLDSETAIEGWKDKPLPKGSVQLVAVGESNGFQRKVEMVVQVPRFPYAIVSSGPIHSNGNLILGGVDSVEDALSGLESEDMHPADLCSNAPGEAVNLKGRVEISGNIQAVGSIQVDSNAVIRGELRGGSDPVTLRTVDLQSIRPQTSEPLGSPISPKLEGFYHWDAPELMITGGLELNEGVLYVNGDLQIFGGVRGKGAILANGSVTVHGGASLAASNDMAIVAKGDVNLLGNSQKGSFYQGVVYTEGDFLAQNVTILGTFIANRERSSVDPGSRVSLVDARVVELGKEGLSLQDYHFEIIFSPTNPHRSPLRLRFDFSPQQRRDFFSIVHDSSLSRRERDDRLTAIILQLEVYKTGDSVGGNRTREPLGPLEVGHRPPPLSKDDAVRRILEIEPYKLRMALESATGGDGDQTSVSSGSFNFDLNEFLGLNNRTRIVDWQEY